MTLERGTLLHNRYRIIEILGQGGMGSVYRAIDENLGVEVAVKENLFTTEEYARQFRLEAVILANLRHPNLTRVTDHFVIGDQGQYLVMDYIRGEDLRERMERLGTISEEDAILIGVAVCNALSHLHTRKPSILHRDLKPGNVKITPEGHIFLVDFGLAKILKGTQATTTGARAMTPGYSPPEQYGTARTDPRTDIYSLGATLYAALSGTIPEDGFSRAMDQVELTPLRKRNPKTSRRLAGVIEKAMSINVEERYQTAEEFRQALISSNPKTLHLKGEILIDPPPVVEDGEEIVETPDPSISGNIKLDSQPIALSNSKVNHNKGLGSSFWIFLSFTLLLVLGAVVAVPYFWEPLSRVISDIRSTPTPSATASPTQQNDTGSLVLFPSPFPELTATLQIETSPSLTPQATVVLIPSQTPTPISTALGGGNGQIAFASDRSGIPQIFISTLDSDDPVQITSLEEGACQPDWSPDGSKLVFISPCKERADNYPGARLYSIDVNGTGLTPLSFEAGGDFDPAWSPDGTRIAFTSLRDGYAQVYLIDLKSGSVERLTQTDSSQPARQPAWNSRANEIAYSIKRFDAWEIWAMTDTGSDPKRLVLSDPNKWDTLPAWSPDGATIIFSQSKKLSSTNWLMSYPFNNEKAGLASTLNNGSFASDADYSADGHWLVFENIEDLNFEIYTLDLISGSRHRITDDPASDFDPVWRPLP